MGLAERDKGHKTMTLGVPKRYNPPLFKRRQKPCVIRTVRASVLRVSAGGGGGGARGFAPPQSSRFICKCTASSPVLCTLIVCPLVFEHLRRGTLIFPAPDMNHEKFVNAQ